MTASSYTREQLISICEQAIVQEKDWYNRDSEQSMRQLGACWALLKAGCQFRICDQEADEPTRSDDRTIWIEISSKGFGWFEEGDKRVRTRWLPTPERLAQAAGKDWYC